LRATFLILGARCTRNCGFCAIKKEPPGPPDPDEPRRVALTARSLGLKYIVLTSVTRDDLPDGGASHFSKAIQELKNGIPGCRVEVLIPDFAGKGASLEEVLKAQPDVLNHNVETVKRLYPAVRPEAVYDRSLWVFREAKRLAPNQRTKSGLMVGLGEGEEEVFETLSDLRNAGCDMVTLGQYLRPSVENLPVREYVHPEGFAKYKMHAEALGFVRVLSGPLVRSSMDAEEMMDV